MSAARAFRARPLPHSIFGRGAALVILAPEMNKLEAEPVDSDRDYPWGVDVDGLVAEHMDFARAIARDWEGRGCDPDELESEATVALWRAARSYKPGQRTFKAWAERYIVTALVRLVHDQPFPGGITVPRDVMRDKRKLYKAAAELMAEGVDRPTPGEVCERAGIDLESAREALGLPGVQSLDEESH
jgi:DNA-directed RNA polymerase specialized sigma subunit